MYTDSVKRALFERVSLKEIAEAVWIAAGVVFLASDESRYMTGQDLTIDGGYVMDGSLPGANTGRNRIPARNECLSRGQRMDKSASIESASLLRQAKLDALLLRLPENIVMALRRLADERFFLRRVHGRGGPAGLGRARPAKTRKWAIAGPKTFGSSLGPGCRWAIRWRRFAAALSDLSRRHKLARASIGYEGSFECVAPAHNAGRSRSFPAKTPMPSCNRLCPSARWSTPRRCFTNCGPGRPKRKSPGCGWRIAWPALGLKKFHEAVAPGITEAELAAMVYEACLTRGVRLREARHVNVYPQVSSGPNAHRAWRPVVTTGRRRLRKGEIALLELAVCVDGFWADVTRVKIAGRPTRLQQRGLCRRQGRTESGVGGHRSGRRGPCSRTKRRREVLVEAGFEKYMVHLTGHGLGFRYHEPEPFLMPGNTMILEVGHVCSVEPGLYDPAFGGIRLEDNVADHIERGGEPDKSGEDALTNKKAPNMPALSSPTLPSLLTLSSPAFSSSPCPA